MTDWYNSSSSVEPILVDTESSKTHVYLRRNVTKKEVSVMNSEDTEFVFMYEERNMTKEEYVQYKMIEEQTEAILNVKKTEIIDAYTLELMKDGVI